MPFSPRRLTVYCGSRHGRAPAYREGARAVGRLLVARGLGLVYGGGMVGLMGEVADAVLEAGGEAIGIIPRNLARKEVAHEGLTELYVVATMHERKAMMSTMGGGFLALPGGLGTLEELFEVVTAAQLGLHRKPIGLLDPGGFYGPLHAMLDHSVEEGFVDRAHRDLVVSSPDPGELLDLMTERAEGR